jgi:hypothetical protein
MPFTDRFLTSVDHERMEKLKKSVNISTYDAVEKTNARWIKFCCVLVVPGLILPFVLPESPWLADSFLLQQLGSLIPSAHKLASVAQFPAVVYAYIVIMLTIAFVLGLANLLLVDSYSAHTRAEIVLSPKRTRKILWLKALFGIFFFTAFLALFYIFPGQPDGNPQGSKGQLMVSLMVMTKPGLAVFGSAATMGAAIAWFVWPIVIFNTFYIPFMGSETKE